MPTLIAPGKQVGVLDAALAGEPLGTFVHAPPQPETGSRKRWLCAICARRANWSSTTGPTGRCVNAARAFPSGITEVRGTFEAGEPVEILSTDAVAVARGFSSYGSDELRRICGLKTADIVEKLGYKLADEAVHRDDLVLLETLQAPKQKSKGERVSQTVDVAGDQLDVARGLALLAQRGRSLCAVCLRKRKMRRSTSWRRF